MKLRSKMLVAITALLLAPWVQAELVTEAVSYEAGDTTMQGYIAYDDALEGERPGVLVVHEWWGHNDYARKRAEMLAELGYTALAVDMYGEGKTADHPKAAGQFAGAVRKNLPVMKERFLAGLEMLKAHDTVAADDIAAIGYCFGGGVVLEMARQGVDIDGVASFHGSLGASEPAQPGAVKADVFVANGAADPMTTEEQIKAFKAEMTAAGADYEFHNYEGVKHSFTNPNADQVAEEFDLPLGYDEEADKDSWAKLQAFFEGIFAD